jgi:hypothetical protein
MFLPRLALGYGPPISTSKVAEIIGMKHHAGPDFTFLKESL